MGQNLSSTNASVSQKMHPVLRIGLLAYIVVTASACYVLILKGLESAPPLAFAGYRTILGGLSLILFSALSGQRVLPERRLWAWLPLVALTATTLTFGSMFLSPSFAGAGLASILGNAQPLFIVVIGFVALGERLSRWQTLALLVGLAGVVIIISPTLADGSSGLLVGALIALTTSLAAAIGTVIVRYLKLADSLLQFTGCQLFAGGVLLILLSIVWGEPVIAWNWSFVGIVVILGIFNSAIVTWAWFYLLQREKAGKLSIYLFLTPVLGIVWAMLFANEQPHPASWVGGAFVLIAVFLKEFEGFRNRLRLNK